MKEETQARAAWWVEPLGEAEALDILSWRYDPPYDFYNPPVDVEPTSLVSEFLRPELGFHAVYGSPATGNPSDSGGTGFIGFCSFGIDGQVPGGDYAAPALDIGLGMRPELTGHGIGSDFFSAILTFAIKNRPVRRYRLTVADFNGRAIALYRKFGFIRSDQFVEPRTGVSYTVLIRHS